MSPPSDDNIRCDMIILTRAFVRVGKLVYAYMRRYTYICDYSLVPKDQQPLPNNARV